LLTREDSIDKVELLAHSMHSKPVADMELLGGTERPQTPVAALELELGLHAGTRQLESVDVEMEVLARSMR
jgi:hypothetical protein